jgi:aldehyde dehydrogenase (NAD+)
MGPLVTDGHRARVLKMIAGAVSAGATVATGGAAPAVPELSDGCYVSPTVLVDVAAGASIWRDEVFGPVVVVRTVADLDAAVDAVNDSDYGLSASVFTASLESAYRFVTAVETGQVAVNLPTTGWDVQFPFGGFGDSGTAPKEQGEDALRFFTRIKTVAIRYDPRRP